MSQRGGTTSAKSLKLEMNKIKAFVVKKKAFRRESTQPLIENNNDIQDGFKQAPCTKYENALVQNTLDIHKEQRLQSEEQITPEKLAGLLQVSLEDGSCCSTHRQLNAEQQHLCLVQRSVDQHFPKLPPDVDQNLHQYLENVQKMVITEFVRLGSPLTRMGLMGSLIDCYHRETFTRLDDLLQNVRSSKNSFGLMKWVLHTYLSPEMLCHPQLQEMDPIKNVDLLLFTEWVRKAKDKLLENVENEVNVFLEKILQNERDKEIVKDDLYVDTIQCIDAMIEAGRQISQKLSGRVQDVCFQELLNFLTQYTNEQTEILEKKAKVDKPEIKDFFKTLNNCKEIKQYIQRKKFKTSLLKETLAVLDNMETFTVKVLKEITADMTERYLKKYFKSENKEFLLLILDLKHLFSELQGFQGVQMRVVHEAYKLVTYLYLKHFIQRSKNKLLRCWSPDVGLTVNQDAEMLQETFSKLAPGVEQWHLMLLSVRELDECESFDAVKLTVARMHHEYHTWSEFMEILPALLRWKGLSKRKIMELEDILKELPNYQPRAGSVSWFLCFYC